MNTSTRRPLLHRSSVLVLGVVAFVASIGWGLATIPPGPVPTHWSGSSPDGWTDRDSFLLVQLPLLGVGVTAFLLGLAWLMGRSSSLTGLNVPNREEWARPEHRPVAVRQIRAAMTGLAGLVLLLLAAVPVTVGAAVDRPGQTLPGLPFTLAVAVFIAAVVVWVVGLLRAFGPPTG